MSYIIWKKNFDSINISVILIHVYYQNVIIYEMHKSKISLLKSKPIVGF